MMSQAVTIQVGKKRGDLQEGVDTLRILKVLRMNTPSFTSSTNNKDLENFINELKNLLEVMHVANTERVEVAAY